MDGTDILVAVLVALLVVVMVLFGYPGWYRVTAGRVAGRWRGRAGDLYLVRAAGRRGLAVTGGEYAQQTAPGRLHGLRGVEIAGRRAALSLDGRYLNFRDGGQWTRQGTARN